MKTNKTFSLPLVPQKSWTRKETLHEQIICSVLCNICSNSRNFWDTEKWSKKFLFAKKFLSPSYLLSTFFNSHQSYTTAKQQRLFKILWIPYKTSLDKNDDFFLVCQTMMMSWVNTESKERVSELRRVLGKTRGLREDLQMNRELKAHYVSSPSVLFIQSF